ncbi:MAG: DNA repair protein RecO [Planctomycetota bacterium]
MPTCRDRALILKRYPFSESSLVIHVGTREHGRVHVMAKGAYRTSARYYAALDLLDTLEIEWDESPRRELANLRAATIVSRRRSIPADPGRWSAACSLLELADLAFRPSHPDPSLYDLLEASLTALDDPACAPDCVLVAFELGFLERLGLTPSLETCAACGGPAPEIRSEPPRVAFSAGAGGRLCPSCASEARAAGRRVGTLPSLTLADALEFARRGSAAGAGLSQERIDRVRDFVGRFLDYHLETRPRTHRAFLATPNRNAARGSAE